MSGTRGGRWTLLAGLAGVVVFLAVCALVLAGARADRERLETRLAWLMDLQSAERGADDGRAVAASKALAACDDCEPATRAAAQDWLAEVESPGTAPPPSPRKVAATLAFENSNISARLHAAWHAAEVLLGCAVAFAIGFLLLLLQARRRARETTAAYDALARETCERETAQRTLRDEQALSKGIFDFAPIGIHIFDARGFSRRVNPELLRILALEGPDGLVDRYNVLTDPFALETGLAERVGPAFRGEIVEIRGRRVDLAAPANQWRTRRQALVLDEVYFPLHDTAGQVAHVVGLFRDDTENRAAHDRLSLAERLAAVGTLAAGVAHEINNPLTFIHGNIVWLARVLGGAPDALREDLRAEVAAALAEAGDGVARVRGIVQDLSTFSRGHRSKAMAVRLRDIIEPALRMLVHELRHRATVVDAVPADATVQADPVALGQVILNLVQNAVHAIEPGRPAAERIALRTGPGPTGFLRLSIEDTGRGIAPEIAARVFEPFFTTKPVGQGMGLGLSVTRGIVESMGGQIAFVSTPGRGTTFHVDLPEAPAPGVAVRDAAPSLSGPRLRVLVIDDEPMLAPSLRRLLGKRHEVVGIDSGAAALACLQGDRRWDAILLDVMMPELDGRAVLTALQSDAPELLPRVVLMSGGTFSAESDLFWRGFEGPRLAKPFETGALERAIGEAAGVELGPG